MLDAHFWGMARVAGLFLVLGALFDLAGVLMFAFRGGHRGGAAPSRAFYLRERGLIMAGVVLTAIGFVLLEAQLQSGSGGILARIGATGYLFAGVLVVAGEALNLNLGYDKSYPLMLVYVVAAFLGQAAVGGALLRSGLLAAWIGWATIVWNLGFLCMLSLFSRRDMYFPVLHHVAPLLIGIALLLTATGQ
jgi:hypothetical protein